ncbi:unnamed protein product, partial [Didymodactylos carnosus]
KLNLSDGEWRIERTRYAYAVLHAARKIFSNVKASIAEEWSPNANYTQHPLKPDNLWNQSRLFHSPSDATVFLGVLDAVFMFAYATGLFISGIIGDRFDLRIILSSGMCLTAVFIVMFGVVSEWLHLYSIAWYVVFWILNGLAQSTAWPCVIAIMGNWFGTESRGLIFGVWSACASVGNIFGAALAAAFLRYGYEYPFLVVGILLFCCSIINLFGLVTSPAQIGINVDDSAVSVEDVLNQSEVVTENEIDTNDETAAMIVKNVKDVKPITFFRAWLLPGVLMYSLCYACLKLVNYSFFFWLPYYLHNKFHWEESAADLLSTLYDVGGIFGGIIGGLISDKIGFRSIVVVPQLLLAVPTLFIFSNLGNHKAVNGVLMTIAGVFIGGVANMISAAITTDLGNLFCFLSVTLGRQEILRHSHEALSTVTGIVDGTGSYGAAIGQILIPVIMKKFNWQYVFYFFIIMTLVTCLCILPLFIRECREVFERIMEARSDTTSSINHFNELPDELVQNILIKIGHKLESTSNNYVLCQYDTIKTSYYYDYEIQKPFLQQTLKYLLNVMLVCKRFHSIINSNLFWLQKCLNDHLISSKQDLNILIKNNVQFIELYKFNPFHYGHNFVKNPCGQLGLQHWSIGDEGTNSFNYRASQSVDVEQQPGGSDDLLDEFNRSCSCFVTSYYWGRIEQKVEFCQHRQLYEKLRPTIEFTVYIAARFDCASQGCVQLEFYDENAELKHKWNYEKTFPQWNDRHWTKVVYKYQTYELFPSYVNIIIRGKDRQFWAGAYGTKFSRITMKLILKKLDDESTHENLELETIIEPDLII